MKKTETEQIRLANRNQIIDTLRNMGPMARVDIGKLLKLSPATITAITSDLMQEGLLSEIESTPQGVVARGRPRVLIALNPNAVFVIGIKLSMDELRLMLGNMSGEIVAESLVELNTMNLSAEQLINKLIEEIQRFKNDQSKEHLAIHSIGIAVQGVVDAINGHIVWSPAIAQRNISVAEPLSAKFSVPVVLANDANCIAIAIKNQPQYQMLNNYLVVMLGYGVGMGMILNGELYSGHHGAASEFGHTKYNPEGAQCLCGKRGCIEAYVSDYALYRDARTVMELPQADSFHPSEENMVLLLNEARKQNPKALELFQRAGHVLGCGIANIIALLSPDKVIISGPGIRSYEFMQDGIFQGLHNSLVPELIADTTIEPFFWQEDLTGKGIIGMALSAVQAV